jgi:hypothetical protein
LVTWKTAGGKRRTRGHVIADLSVNHVERYVLRCGWTAQRTTHDYGIDLLIETFNVSGEPETGRVLVQLKATDKLRLRDVGKTVALRLDWRDVQAWQDEPMPVILILYDAKEDKAYWLHVQSQLAGRRQRSGRPLRSTTVYLPRSQVVNEAAIRQFAEFRDAVLARIRRVIFHEE